MMGFGLKILPVCGEGDHEVVEGGVRCFNVAWLDYPPSVSPAASHLPVNGEDLG
jgi:hypothetical protein